MCNSVGNLAVYDFIRRHARKLVRINTRNFFIELGVPAILKYKDFKGPTIS